MKNCLRPWPTTTAATTASPGWGWSTTASATGASGRRPLRHGPRRRVPRHQHLRHPADRARLPPPRPRDRRPARRLHLPHDAQLLFAGRIRARRFRARGPGDGHLDRLLVERQGLRRRRAPDRAGPDRRGRRRRRRHAVPDHAVRLRLAAADLAASPAARYDAARDGISIGEGAGFALLERAADPAPGSVLLLGAGESSDAYHMSTPHPRGPRRASWRWKPRSRRRGLAAGRHRLHQPARHRDARQRRRRGHARSPRCSATACPAARPRARPATRWARPVRSKR